VRPEDLLVILREVGERILLDEYLEPLDHTGRWHALRVRAAAAAAAGLGDRERAR
jgi:hypothetical protein